MSLIKPHLLWLTCGSNPFEVNKAVIQARMLSGRYITDKLARHWSQNEAGHCSLPTCSTNAIGSLEHFLLFCPALQEPRDKMMKLCHDVSETNDIVKSITKLIFNDPNYKRRMQFLLDCSTIPEVIQLTQRYNLEVLGQLFYISRNWCYAIHRSRMTQLGLYKYR